MDNDQFFRILDRTGYSRQGYRKVRKGVKRRLVRHMMQTGYANTDAYLELLHRSPEAMDAYQRLMTVPISRFFRDTHLWDSLKMSVLPELIERFAAPLRVWSAGCASGEEVYSFKILWEEAALGRAAHILATDLSSERIERAQAGIYQTGSLRNVSDDLRERWFDTLKKGTYRVRNALRGDIRWHTGNVTEVHANFPFQLVFLRNNVLTYEASPRRESIFAHVYAQMATGGLMIIGAHETLPDPQRRFERRAPFIHRLV